MKRFEIIERFCLHGGTRFRAGQNILFHFIIVKVEKEKLLFEQKIYHGTTVDLIPKLYGGKSDKAVHFSDWIRQD